MFGIKNKLISQNNLLIKIDEVTIERVNNSKFLGVIIHSTLSWKDHITNLCKRVSKNIEILNKITTNVNNDILLTLYNILHLPTLTIVISFGQLVNLFIVIDCS